MRTLLKGALAVSILMSCAAPTPAQVSRPQRGITAEDYYAFEFLSDPHLSPDGQWVAYVVTNVDQRQNRRLSQIWLAAADGPRSSLRDPRTPPRRRKAPRSRTPRRSRARRARLSRRRLRRRLRARPPPRRRPRRRPASQARSRTPRPTRS